MLWPSLKYETIIKIKISTHSRHFIDGWGLDSGYSKVLNSGWSRPYSEILDWDENACLPGALALKKKIQLIGTSRNQVDDFFHI